MWTGERQASGLRQTPEDDGEEVLKDLYDRALVRQLIDMVAKTFGSDARAVSKKRRVVSA